MHTRLGLMISLAACITPLQSQEASQGNTPSFQAGTRMVLVPVVVRDHDGHTVSDLSRDSFQLFDKGKPQPIASFSVERSEAAGSSAPSATPPAQFIVYFFDDVSLHDFGTVSPLREAALHELAGLRPADRMAVFSSSCNLTIDFTGDHAKLQEVISKLNPNPVHVCRVAPTMPLQITLLEAVVKRMAHVPGAKRIVVISAGYPVNRDEQTVRETLIDEAAQEKVVIDSLHIVESTGLQSGVPTSGHQTSGMPKGGSSDGDTREVNSENLNIVADGTGGTVVEAGNKPEAGLRALATPDCVYMLGFVPAEKADGSYHKLKVTLKDPRKLNVRARAGYDATETAGTPQVTAAVAPPEAPEKKVTAGDVPKPVTPAPAAKAVADAPERAASTAPVSFRSRTNLVQVPVVVRDKNGNPVGDLHKSDFQLSDRGQKQEITAFNEEKLEQPATVTKSAPQSTASDPAAEAKAPSNAVPDRFTAYIFDDVHMPRGDLAQVREAVWRNLKESASPSERIAVFTTSRRIFTDFTDNLDTLHTALYKINSTAMYRSVCTQCGDLSFFLGYQVARGNTLALQLASGAVQTPAQQVAGSSAPAGRGGTTSAPSNSAQTTSNTGSQESQQIAAELAATRAVRLGEQETALTLDALRDVSRRMVSLAGRRTIVLISQGVFIPDEQQGEMERTIDWALRSGVVVNTLNGMGLSVGVLGPAPGGGGGPSLDLGATTASEDDTVEPSGASTPYTNEARTAEMQNLVYIAEATGGTAIARSNDYLAGIKRIASPPEYRYILGFASHDLAPDGKFHAVAIKLTNPALKGDTVQARKGYYAPKQGEGLPEAAAKEIESAIFSRDDIRDLPVEMRTDVKKSEGSGGELTVSTDIDLKLLHYRKVDGRNCQELTAVAAVFDKDGNFVAGKQQTLTLKLRDASMDGLGQKPAETLQSAFALSPGAYLVRLVVRSAEDQTMTEVSTPVDVK